MVVFLVEVGGVLCLYWVYVGVIWVWCWVSLV